MSEHTDAARLEATRDAIRTGTAPRPRVEGEAVRRPLDRTLVRLYAEFTDAECATHGDAGAVIRDLALNLLDADSSVVRLTAEVERLTKEKAALRRMIEEDWTEGWWEDAPGWEDKMREAIERELALHLAALALPTPAPEATNDGK